MFFLTISKFKKQLNFKRGTFQVKTSAKVGCEGEHASLGALQACVFGHLLIEISSRKAVPEVTAHFPALYMSS